MNWFSKGENPIRDNFSLENKIPNHQGIKSRDCILSKLGRAKKVQPVLLCSWIS